MKWLIVISCSLFVVAVCWGFHTLRQRVDYLESYNHQLGQEVLDLRVRVSDLELCVQESPWEPVPRRMSGDF